MNGAQSLFKALTDAGLARVVCHWTREAKSAGELALQGAEAVQVAQMGSGRIATLVAPTNCPGVN